MSEKKLYRDYFNIDPKYYSAVTADLISSGKVSWKNFYPHETFIKLLEKTHAVLSRKEPRSLWVEGAYGTGKSHAALTVKSMLDATDEEIRAYFADYGLSNDLCQKLITDKNAGKLITIHRIGSGAIRSDRDLILAMQDSITQALAAHGIENRGEASLRDAALKWFEKAANRKYFDELIREEEYAWTFGGEGVDAVIERLKGGSPEQVTGLMRDIIAVAEDNGITALRMDIQGMAAWIKSVIEVNRLSAILFVWDEFTEFIQNNQNSLTGFQTLAEISQSHPFYFMIVTHESRKLFVNQETARKILDRFVPPIKIELPENMAFRLMAQAMKVTDDPVMKKEWLTEYRDELNGDLAGVRAYIRDTLKKNSRAGQKTDISDAELQGVMPIHPYAALLLKHLSVAFRSNQRSMFDFIISNDEDAKAFKWYIGHYGPLDTCNLLTMDMLWDFFYVKGQSGLNDEVRVILDSYSLLDSDKLTSDEQRVLKAVLLFQAITMRVSDVELLRPTEQNIDMAFTGMGWQPGKARGLAGKLINDGLLFKKSVGGGKFEYTVANLNVDVSVIRKIKEEVIAGMRTQDLLTQVDMMGALELPAPIAGRFVSEPAATKNFTAALTKLSNLNAPDRFKALVCFALSDEEASALQGQILKAVSDEKNADILFIDASPTPFGRDRLDQYAESMAYNRNYAQNDKQRAGEYKKQADKVLSDWKDKLALGAFVLYSAEHPSGIRMADIAALRDELGMINHRRYPYGPEQYRVIGNMFAKGPTAQGAECGILQKLSGTFKSSNANTSLDTALAGAWKVERYWEDAAKQGLAIVKIKQKVEELVAEGFESQAAKVSMSKIYAELTHAPYGLMPNNITAFVLGFVLKEYANSNYFWSNDNVSDAMSVDKMKTMIAGVINQAVSPGKNFREEYIVAMSGEQRAFLTCTQKVFRIPAAQCGSVEHARDQIRMSMKNLKFPIWCVKYALPELPHEADTALIGTVIDNYCAIANTANANMGTESELASAIGKAVLDCDALTDDLAALLNSANCSKGMAAYIAGFEGGALSNLAAELGDNGAYMDAVKQKFNADAANWVWNRDTADEKIRDVILDYRITRESNRSLPKCTTVREAVRGWNSRTNNIRISYEAMKSSLGDLEPLMAQLHVMKQTNELTEQHRAAFYELLLTQRESFDRFYADQLGTFRRVAAPFLNGLDDEDVAAVFSDLPNGQFTKSRDDYFRSVEQTVQHYQQNQLKNRIRDTWKAKTGTKGPDEWSSHYETPLLCMFDDAERPEARRMFSLMRGSALSDTDAARVLDYLTNASFYDRLGDAGERDRCFRERIMGDYAVLLKDVQSVRDYLIEHSSEKVYDWMDNSAIQKQIHTFADKQYKLNGYTHVQSIIDGMDPIELREYLAKLVADNITVGIEILKKG